MRKLTAKQRRFTRERANGATLSDAYTDAGYGKNTTKENKRKNAWKLENTSAAAETIKAEIARLQSLAEAGAIADRQHRQAILTEILLDANEATADRLRASDQLNRMSGDYNDRLQTEATVSLSYADRLALMRSERPE